MAAPSPTARSTPGGIPLKSGHPTKITVALDPDISFWEVEITPAGIEGGEPIDQTTMFNLDVVTKAEGDLVDITPASGTAVYDPAVLTQIMNIVNRPTTITEHYQDGSSYAYYGVFRSFMRQSHVRGQQPRGAFVIYATNFDPTNRVEAVPVLTSVAGT